MTHQAPRPEDVAQQLRRCESELELLGCDLHDGLIQYVTAAHMMLSALRRRLEQQSKDVPDELLKATDYLQEAAREGRQLIASLQPNSASGANTADMLTRWIRSRVAAAEIPVDVQIELPNDLDSSLHRAIFRITQEALNNALQHSHASKISVAVQTSGADVVISVEDDGGGFEPSAVESGHYGLSSMRTRAEAVKGTLEIRSEDGLGTRVLATLPRSVG